MTEGQHPEYRPRPQPASSYGYPPAPRDDRPGAAVGAAVFGFIVSGFLLLAAVILIEGASLIGTISDHGGSGSEFTFDGLVNIAAAALLISGGVALLGRKQSGRPLLFAGVAVVVVEGIYWFGRFANGALFFWVCLFVVPALIAAGLAAKRR